METGQFSRKKLSAITLLKKKYSIVPEYDALSHQKNNYSGHNSLYTTFWIYKNGIKMIPFIDKYHAVQAVSLLAKAELEATNDKDNEQN